MLLIAWLLAICGYDCAFVVQQIMPIVHMQCCGLLCCATRRPGHGFEQSALCPMYACYAC
jgi:hypothetical protein